jgi:hypothetical protein
MVEHLLFFVFAFVIVNCCLNLAIIYILSKNKITQSQEDLAKIVMRFLIIVGIISLMGLCVAQEEEEPVITVPPDGDKPVAFPDAMPKAAEAISDLSSEVARMSDIGQFISGWWPVPLNNSSVLNLTA